MKGAKRYAVYRLMDGAVVLYVGLTSNPSKRLKEHRQVYAWARNATIEYDWVGGIAKARSVERQQIKALKPVHNIIHSTEPAIVESMPFEDAARVWLTNPHLPMRDVLAMMPGWHYTMAWECFGPRHRTEGPLLPRTMENKDLRDRLLAEAGLI